MLFKIIKSSPDGLCHNGELYPLQDVFAEVLFSKGWVDTKAMHDSIKTWAAKCQPGDVFCTSVSAIIAVQPERLAEYDKCPHCDFAGVDYGDLVVNEDAAIEQKVKCLGCGRQWVDIFALVKQTPINGNSE